MPAMDVYRVRVSHEDADHHMNVEAFYGPAFDGAFSDAVEHATGEPVDLLEHALASAGRCRIEFPDADGFTTRVVQLHANSSGDGTWEEVV